MKIQLEPGKREYTEAEAARALELSPAQFRFLLMRHMVQEEENLTNLAIMRFRPSDLLLLSLLVDGQMPCCASAGVAQPGPNGSTE
jgi:hypothetical protein